MSDDAKLPPGRKLSSSGGPEGSAVNVSVETGDLRSGAKGDGNTGTSPTTKGSGGKKAATKQEQSPKGQGQGTQKQGAPRQLFDSDLTKVLNATIDTIDTSANNPDEVAEGLEIAGVRSWSDSILL